MIGTKLGNRYEITGELGRGGMGVVYRARDPLLGRDVAVKLIPPAALSSDAEERFQREAQIVAQMDHPGIVSIYDLGRHDGSLFFVMPVVTGTSLRHLLRDHSLSLGDVVDLGAQVADALDYSHGRGVVHRDIKPENVMADRRSGQGLRVRVMDFGLARGATETRLTKTGTFVGTIAYLSPEQVAADAPVDGRSDLYSLGTLLYECLAGEPPFSGEMQTLLYRIVHELPQPLRALGVDVSEELDAIILACLAKDPKKRPASASQLSESLRRYGSKLQESERVKSVALSSTRTMAFARPAASPFVGREKELAQLQQRFSAALAGECQLAVVAGEPGVGKSRLLEELENLARARKIRVLHGRFIEQDRAFAYQGFCELIQDFFLSKEGSPSSSEHPDFSDLAADLVTLFPVLTEISDVRSAAQGDSKLGPAGEARKVEDRTYIFEILAKTLTRIGAGKPLVLFLEELHGADVSIDALGYIVRRLGPTPTLIVGTYRTTEIEKQHPLVKLLDGFGGDRKFVQMFIGPLLPDEHRALLATLVGGGNLSDELAEKIYDATEGNAFFTKELVRSLIDSGGILRDGTGAWNLSGEMAISSDSLPATIQQAVEKRIERLPESLREVLSLASLVGKSFEFRDLEDLVENDAGLEDAVDSLIHEGLLEEAREGRGERLAFASGVVRDVLYGTLSRRKRRSLHRKYGEKLESRFAGRLERAYPQLLHHFAEGDVAEKAVEYGLRQARKSMEAFSPEDAARTMRTALEFLDDEWEGDRAVEGEARILLAEALRSSGNAEGAIKEAEEAAKIFEAGNQPARAVTAYLLAAETAWQGRRVEETQRFVERGTASAIPSDAPDGFVKLFSLAATVANLRGEYEKARGFLEQVRRLGAAPAEQTEEVTRGGNLVVAMTNPVTAREPSLAGTNEDAEVLSNVFETLLSTDEQGNLVPSLCESWEMREGGTVFLARLREEARFADGTRLTAGEVKLSIEGVIRRAGAANVAAWAPIAGVAGFLERSKPLGEIEGLVVQSDRELEIHLTEPLPIYPALLTAPHTGIARRIAGGSNDDSIFSGTGPFIERQRTGDQVVIERNANYWKGSPSPLDSIEFRTSLSSAAVLQGLRSGEIDVASDLLPSDLEEVLRDPRFRTGLKETPSKSTYFIAFNSFGAGTANSDLRRALAGVIRPRDLVWRTVGRFAEPATGMIPPGILGHDPGRRRRALDREEAIELLKGVRPSDEPIRLRAAVHPILQDKYGILTTEILSLWRNLGVEVSVETPDMESYVAALTGNAPFDLTIGRWLADFDDPDGVLRALFHSQAGIWRDYFSSDESDSILEMARSESRPAARETLYRRYEALLLDQNAVVPLFHEVVYRICGPRVSGLKMRSAVPSVTYSEASKQERRQAPRDVVTGGGTIQAAMSGIVRSLDPSLTATVEQGEVIPNIFETVTRDVEGANIVPWLAAEFHAENGNRRFRFRLRDDVRFHDGRRLTARDVRYSYERLLKNKRSESRNLLAPILGARALIDGGAGELEGFRIVSSLEFTIDLVSPVSFFPVLISYPAAGIVPEGTTDIGSHWRERCVGTGPYRVVNFEAEHRLELERHPGYWRPGFPRNDGLVFRFGAGSSAILNDFQAGRLSLAADLLPADVEGLRHDAALAAGYRETPRLSTYFVLFNMHRPFFAGFENRRRIVDSVDVAALVRKTLGRLAIPANGIIPPGLLGFSSQPAGARSGGGPGADRAAPSSEPPIELKAAVHPIFFGEYAGFSRELYLSFKERGIRVRAVNTNMTEFLEARAKGEVDLVVARWVADYPDADTFVHGVLHTRESFLGSYCGTPEIDLLADRARAESDPAVRHALYREVEEIIRRDALLLPLFHEQVYRFARPEVEGLSISFSRPVVNYESLRIRR